MGQTGWACAVCGGRYEADVLFCPRDGAPVAPSRFGVAASPDPYLGRELARGIRLERLIGVGSMSRVYEGTEPGLDRRVAVKVLHRELSGNSQIMARFEREARIVRGLVHPHVVQMFESGTLSPLPGTGPAGRDPAMYMVMEYLDGISLRSAMAAARGPLPLERAVAILLQAADGVAEAHRQGIVHRDLKPENLILVRAGRGSRANADFVKVVDFGLARLLRSEGPATEAGLVFGTAQYMSPEGAAGERVGPAADVYALATILYEALTTSLPFAGDKALDVVLGKVEREPVPLQQHAAGRAVPEALADFIMRNLSRRPEERSRDAGIFARELAEIVRPSTAGAAPTARLGSAPGSSAALPPRPASPAAEPRAESISEAPEQPRSRAGRALGIVLLCVTAGAVAAALIARNTDRAHAGAASTAQHPNMDSR